MREVCKGEIVRPGATRFATNHIALDSLLKKKANLKQLFISDAWASNQLSRTTNVKKKERCILDLEFWNNVTSVVKIYEPMYHVLRLVDTEVVPTIPIVYNLLKVAAKAGDDNENLIFDWVKPTFLDDDEKTPDPHIVSHARDIGIDVEQVIREEVGVDSGVIVSSSSDDQHTSDGNSGGKDDGDDGDGGD
ncbi:hypothetical protein Ddye_008241 [Dipteronia dyeriana]|uniref:Uncharacterized protein n=1 Tax=Dipteronia dyeriana TaxID=168575 RepID=A0AAD9X970_9ROSI|nr:hypothetical protein Ddye_008241 [Dipteronia dyeriana]